MHNPMRSPEQDGRRIIGTTELERIVRDSWPFPHHVKVFGVPRGGWGIAALLAKCNLAVHVDNPESSDIIVDDIIDSGETKTRWRLDYKKPFWAPFDKTVPGLTNVIPWIVFPWEVSADIDAEAEDIPRRFLQFIGEDPSRPGLLETPSRVVRSWSQLFNGYGREADLKTFDSENDSMIICKNIEFYSTCEHHLIPFFGHVSVGYLPKGKVVGLSKLARLVEVYSRRLQIQEQLAEQISGALGKVEGVRGVGVVVEARHLCMCGRGVSKQDSAMVTSSMTGEFRDDPAVRSEFLRLIQ